MFFFGNLLEYSIPEFLSQLVCGQLYEDSKITEQNVVPIALNKTSSKNVS